MLCALSRSSSLGSRLAFFNRRSLQCPFLCLSTSNAAPVAESSAPQEHNHLIIDHLVTKLGFSSDNAIKASKRLSHIKSLEKPESFVGFMRTHGFSDAQIKKIVSWYPKCLCSNVEKTLAPKFQYLKDMGFSRSDLILIISSSPSVLHCNFHSNIVPKIQFWQALLRGSRDDFVRLVRYTPILCYSIDKRVSPNLSFFRSCGISDERIAMVVRHYPRFFLHSLRALTAAAYRVEQEMGIPRSSGMFLWALCALHLVSKAKFDAKVKLMSSLGWSKAEFLSAFRRAPMFVLRPDKILTEKMTFLVEEAGCKPAYVARHPVLLMLSFEGRLIPRSRVIKILRSRGLLTRECKLLSVMTYAEKRFREKYVTPYMEEIPELREIYTDALGDRANAI